MISLAQVERSAAKYARLLDHLCSRQGTAFSRDVVDLDRSAKRRRHGFGHGTRYHIDASALRIADSPVDGPSRRPRPCAQASDCDNASNELDWTNLRRRESMAGCLHRSPARFGHLLSSIIGT